MPSRAVVDEATGRKWFLDDPDDLGPGEEVTFLLSLHGGGSVGFWQREYFPAYLYKERYRLVIATPSAATKEPMRRWVPEADDEHLRNIVEDVVRRYGAVRIRSFWLVGHSQGGFTCQRLLNTEYFAARVDGWLSLSGGRIGQAEVVPDFGPPERPAGAPSPEVRRQLFRLPVPETDFSFIYAVAEHEIVALPEGSPLAERYGAGPKELLEEVVDEEPGRIHDTRWEGRFKRSWGREARPGRARIYVYPNAAGGRLIADVVRLDKGHTEGLEPRITERLVQLMLQAPGGKLRALARAAAES